MWGGNGSVVVGLDGRGMGIVCVPNHYVLKYFGRWIDLKYMALHCLNDKNVLF